MPKHHNMNTDTGSYGITGFAASQTKTTTTRVIKKNWRLVCLYGFITLAGIVGSYFTSAWISVGVSIIVALITFLVGLRMIQEAVTITREVR
jgi:hypothetical protein